MPKYGFDNWHRFQQSGVTEADKKAMKAETVVEAFEQTKPDFEHLVEQLAVGIKEGRWTSIVVDDVSGRLPGLVIGKIMSRFALEHGQKPPHQVFLAGGSVPLEDLPEDIPGEEQMNKDREIQLEKYIRDQAAALGNNALFVTEHVILGRTILRLGQALQKNGINIDVAALWSGKDADSLRQMVDENGAAAGVKVDQWFIGKEMASPSDYFSSRVSIGKDDLGVPLDEATGIIKVGSEPVVHRNDEADRDLVILAREKVGQLSDELYEKYLSKEQAQ